MPDDLELRLFRNIRESYRRAADAVYLFNDREMADKYIREAISQSQQLLFEIKDKEREKCNPI